MTINRRITAPRRVITVFLVSLLCLVAKSQGTYYSDSLQARNLKEAFTGTRGMLLNRYVLMSTYNRGALTDYYANGAVSAVYLKTRSYKGFQLGFGGSAILNVKSSDLSQKDPITGLSNRYEIGMFDVDRPKARLILRIEELYLQYKSKQILIRAGNFMIRTPYINPQDGRLRPNFVQGAWLGWNRSEKFSAETWWIHGMAPRSTSGWHKLENSIGMYAQGLTSKGEKAMYRNKQVSAGAAILNVRIQPLPKLEIQLWDQYVENIFNTAMLQGEYKQMLRDSLVVLAGTQLHLQHRLAYGGNSDQRCAYYEGQKQSAAFSARIQLSRRKLNFSFNYLNIFSESRFLMPREWGRDVFYTFMPREKQEGYARLTAYTFKASINGNSRRYRLFFGYGLYYLPEPGNFKQNKYATPSYQQSNFEFTYRFTERARLSFLFVSKVSIGNSYQAKYVFNKTDMWHTTLTFQYTLSNFLGSKDLFM